ncbi:hypothetical protein [Paenibacillus physcomitrellae]|uniref:50S ribosomal protein L33 n=1 Tax=Paenibacillus physcomitrellae TaxID=1619311 RepID=A0ABQ1G763_9BACL|nr:hypothetical protein [Paenibacillus physcomitrellae]GGA38035.1 hypothetical protein GCM10010917_24110 [Paenibacillus physcomitrellae]
MKANAIESQAKKLVGKKVIAYKKDGGFVTGTLVKVSGKRLYVKPGAGKNVRTKAILPLALFDLLAIGTAPYATGGFGGYPGYGYGGYPGNGYGYGGYGGYGGYPGYGYPGGFFL